MWRGNRTEITMGVVRLRGRASSTLEKTFQLLGATCVTQLVESFGLDLPNPLPSDVEIVADFFECVITLEPDSEAHAYDLLFARS